MPPCQKERPHRVNRNDHSCRILRIPRFQVHQGDRSNHPFWYIPTVPYDKQCHSALPCHIPYSPMLNHPKYRTVKHYHSPCAYLDQADAVARAQGAKSLEEQRPQYLQSRRKKGAPHPTKIGHNVRAWAKKKKDTVTRRDLLPKHVLDVSTPILYFYLVCPASRAIPLQYLLPQSVVRSTRVTYVIRGGPNTVTAVRFVDAASGQDRCCHATVQVPLPHRRQTQQSTN